MDKRSATISHTLTRARSKGLIAMRNLLRRLWNGLVVLIEWLLGTGVVLGCLFYGYREFVHPKRTGELVFTIPQGSRLSQLQPSLHFNSMVTSENCQPANIAGRRLQYTCPVTEDTFIWPWQFREPEATITVRLAEPLRCNQQNWAVQPGRSTSGEMEVEAKDSNGCSFGWRLRLVFR